MEVGAKLNNLRIGPRKVRLAADLIRGLNVDSAVFQLRNLNKKCASYLIVLIESAIANAENSFNLHRENLYIKKIIVNEGTTFKRWQPRAFGRAGAIRKRGSKINLVLEEKNQDVLKKENIKNKSDKEKFKKG